MAGGETQHSAGLADNSQRLASSGENSCRVGGNRGRLREYGKDAAFRAPAREIRFALDEYAATSNLIESPHKACHNRLHEPRISR
jgi:hypothetical protein